MKNAVVPINAEYIRNVLRYVDRFKNAIIVIYIDERIIESSLITGYISDICLVHQAGIQVIIVPGARKRIDEILKSAGIAWRIENECRIAPEDAMPLIKMAAFDVANKVMTALAGEKRTAVIGNWVRARRKGIINGTDYGSAGEIDAVNTDSVRTILNSGFIPIFPCIGWSASGKPYNISSANLAKEIASRLLADKLFLIAPGACFTADLFALPPDFTAAPAGHIPDFTLDEAKKVLALNNASAESELHELLKLLSIAVSACENGVARAHILNGSKDGTLPCEIFSDFGSGTMIYKNSYGGIRDMTIDDIPAVLSLIRPFVEKGILLPRTQGRLAADFRDYVVFELDGGIRGCSALHVYDDGQTEIAAVAVNEEFSRMGTGPKLVQFLIERAQRLKAQSVFVLTTQTADWFEQIGFTPASIDSLPQKRKDTYIPARGSKLFRLVLRQNGLS
jgi:amino-acid N-acetyltransferase